MALIRPSRPQLQHGYRSVGYQPNRPRTLHRPRPAPPVLTDLGPPDTTDLYPYQSEGAIWLRGRRSALLGDEMGCIDGEALVVADLGLTIPDNFRHYLLRELYAAWQAAPQSQRDGFRVFSLCEDGITGNQVLDVLDKGERPVVLLTTLRGRKLRLTADHEVRRNADYQRADQLRRGDPICGYHASERHAAGISLDQAVSVEPAGTAHVYDIVCADPHRNFVANGIVVHNCGKTPQLLRAIPNHGQAIVIAPASLRLNWQREADRWRPDLRTRFVTKDDPPTAWNPLPHELLIASYEALPPLEENAVALFPGQDLGQTTLVIDEAHYAKNYKALRSKRLRALAYQCGRVWGATGTPLLNSPQDLWGVLQTLRLHQDTYENWSTLCRIFGGEKNRWGGTIFDPAKGQPDEARERLAAVMLRRKRADVLPDLPAKRYETHYVDVQDHSLIEEMNEVCVAWARDAECEFDALEDLPPFELISSVRAKLAEAKIPAMVDFIGRYEEEKVPLLVFSSHNAPLYVAADREGWAAITGETDMKLRTTLVDCFQQGLLSGLAVSTKAGGVGITLTRASTALFVDRDFTPAVNLQAEDRMARIGQGANHVSIIAMIANHPLDERVNAILARKTALMNAVVG